MDGWRELLYPLGFLAALAFSSRMLLQWAASEYEKRSVVMPLFWKLSLCGNVLLCIHAFIQMQFHVCFVQTCNAIISWRNLNLMQPIDKQVTTRYVFKLLLGSITALLLAFWIQAAFLTQNDDSWFRIPITPWQEHANLNIFWGWHALGFFGLLLFGSRFWIQWWFAEKRQTSYLGRAFWWTSLFGEGLCLIYFLHIKDPVNFIGPLFGLVPYVRNLMLIQKASKSTPQQSQG